MVSITVINRQGQAASIDAATGRSVMLALRDAGFDELQALCGGGCACGTCHVYVAAGHAAGLPPISSLEDDLLDSSAHRTSLSRLSCQLPVTETLSGLVVTIAPDD